MSAFAVVKGQRANARQAERHGVAVVLEDQPTLDRVQAIMRELHLDEELVIEPTLEAVMSRIREGYNPRVVAVDLSESTAPVTELGAARKILGSELKILAIGSVNDVALFRDLRSAGATDYLVKPLSQEALTAALDKRKGSSLGQVVAFIGSRGGLGTTTTAVSCAWLFAHKRQERTALVDLDLHFGTVGLKLDTDPGSGLCEALEQPSRIDPLFVEHGMIKVSDTLQILAAEAGLDETLMVDPSAIDVLLYELRRKFSWVLVDLPRWMTPTQRTALGAATRVVVLCERSLAGLRDTIRLQALMRESAPQARVLLVDAGVASDRLNVPKGEFEKAIGGRLDASLPYDTNAVASATSAGQPPPVTAPHSPLVHELERLVASVAHPDSMEKRKFWGWTRW